MTSAFETIILSKTGDVAEIALNRPRVLNAYNMQMRDDMSQALEAVQDDPDVRCVLLRGEGDRAFCTGADLTEFGTAPSQGHCKTGAMGAGRLGPIPVAGQTHRCSPARLCDRLRY